jgi:hypothetical protein
MTYTITLKRHDMPHAEPRYQTLVIEVTAESEVAARAEILDTFDCEILSVEHV